MKSNELVTIICNKFIKREINIEDFQRNLNLLVFEDEASKSLIDIIHNADNRLEEIRFCSLESNFYPYGLEVAKYLIDEVSRIEV